ncbi:hypothetical protein [Fimbriimonas ginsengisoli]|uniref:Uncharacterized protein n=1 Tax=Fimbriimonas ginsengisoli Gsoil 348 TaxID=661478 RepID=A0A068NUH5_FIMGI|nr:hypothetical protein [Fimbriimonas ginsengisoli]AIE87066.1 hypothetical protein OP10G_3698 [Fimbriimonas ginsengisoli Gsoil 348]
MRALAFLSLSLCLLALGCSSGSPQLSVHNTGPFGATVWALDGSGPKPQWKELGVVGTSETKEFDLGSLAPNKNLRVQCGPSPVQILAISNKSSGGCSRPKAGVLIDSQGRADLTNG